MPKAVQITFNENEVRVLSWLMGLGITVMVQHPRLDTTPEMDMLIEELSAEWAEETAGDLLDKMMLGYKGMGFEPPRGGWS